MSLNDVDIAQTKEEFMSEELKKELLLFKPD